MNGGTVEKVLDQASHVENQWRMYLAEDGWMVYVEWHSHRGEKWRVFNATHENYPAQRAISMTELVKRCDWQVAFRTPKRSRKLAIVST